MRNDSAKFGTCTLEEPSLIQAGGVNDGLFTSIWPEVNSTDSYLKVFHSYD
jgi:hypothetical protein